MNNFWTIFEQCNNNAWTTLEQFQNIVRTIYFVVSKIVTTIIYKKIQKYENLSPQKNLAEMEQRFFTQHPFNVPFSICLCNFDPNTQERVFWDCCCRQLLGCSTMFCSTIIWILFDNWRIGCFRAFLAHFLYLSVVEQNINQT